MMVLNARAPFVLSACLLFLGPQLLPSGPYSVVLTFWISLAVCTREEGSFFIHASSGPALNSRQDHQYVFLWELFATPPSGHLLTFLGCWASFATTFHQRLHGAHELQKTAVGTVAERAAALAGSLLGSQHSISSCLPFPAAPIAL